MRSGTIAALALVAALASSAQAAAGPGTIFFTVGSPRPHVAQLWSVRENGTRPSVIRRRMPVSPEGGVAALSRDGRRVVCICREGEVGSVRTDGTHLRRLGELPRNTRFAVVTLGSNGSAYWVKGGKWIFAQKAGEEPRRVASIGGLVIDERVVPSPDGRRLAIVGYGCTSPGCPAEETQSVLTMRLDGTDRTLVYQSTGIGKEIYDVAWSPDADRLILSDGTGGEADPKGELPVHYPRQLFLVPSDGSNPAGTVVPLPVSSSYPAFSPDGTGLVVTAYLKGGPRLTVAGLDGASPRLVPGAGCRAYCEFAPRAIAWQRG